MTLGWAATSVPSATPDPRSSSSGAVVPSARGAAGKPTTPTSQPGSPAATPLSTPAAYFIDSSPEWVDDLWRGEFNHSPVRSVAVGTIGVNKLARGRYCRCPATSGFAVPLRRQRLRTTPTPDSDTGVGRYPSNHRGHSAAFPSGHSTAGLDHNGAPYANDDRSDKCSGVLSMTAGEIFGSTTSMATEVALRARLLAEDDPELVDAVNGALDIFGAVEVACTRFDPASALMKVNKDPDRWHRVPRVCFDALVEAQRAYERTHGRFDPRIMEDLVALGYAATLPFGGPRITLPASPRHRRTPLDRWRPQFHGGVQCRVRLGPRPVDLGGIGKGLALRWASSILAPVTKDFLINAGGDCFCGGTAPNGQPWQVAVEDPRGRHQPVAVLSVSDRACATSSIRIRRWHRGARTVHHLVDPSTGNPGGHGLLAVTVIERDPAGAEVWSKALFLAGARDVGALAAKRHLAALWVEESGRVGWSRALEPFLLWKAG